jgi:glycosyltransferase involved in cell wall biosynthesis
MPLAPRISILKISSPSLKAQLLLHELNMKKNFIIYAPAINSKTGGAHSILENFLNSIDSQSITDSNWFFIGNSEYKTICAQANINYQQLNLNKKWFLRITYDFLIFKMKYLKNQPPSIVISMQNTTPFCRKCDTTLTYIHQAIPFISNFSPSLIKNLKLFLIKYFYLFFIKAGISNTRAYFIVQSEWLKILCVSKLNQSQDRFLIHRPLPTDIDLNQFKNKKTNKNTFFYPSLFQQYKNHHLLIEAFIQLANNNPQENYVLELTIDDLLISIPHNLIIKYYGFISRSETLQKINNAMAVIYPSTIESYGMPIAESLYLNTPVLASDLPYARELMGEKGVYFDPNKAQSIKVAIENFLKKNHVETTIPSDKFQDWAKVLANFLYKINK